MDMYSFDRIARSIVLCMIIGLFFLIMEWNFEKIFVAIVVIGIIRLILYPDHCPSCGSRFNKKKTIPFREYEDERKLYFCLHCTSEIQLFNRGYLKLFLEKPFSTIINVLNMISFTGEIIINKEKLISEGLSMEEIRELDDEMYLAKGGNLL